MRLYPAMFLIPLALGGCIEDGATVAPPPPPSGDDEADDTPEEPLGPLPFLTIGHRGAPWSHPENTMPALASAISDGANSIEIDLVITSDDTVVLWHDRSPDDVVALARQCGAEGLPYIPWVPALASSMRRPVEELTLEALRANYGYAIREGVINTCFSEQERIQTAEIPTFAQFATWSRDTPELAAVFLDIKLAAAQTELADKLARQVDELTRGVVYQIFFMTPHESIILELEAWFAEHRPGHRHRFILDMEDEGALAATFDLGYDTVSTGKTVYRPWIPFMEEIETIVATKHSFGVDTVIAWTIDDPGQLDQLVAAGVDGIMTNKPAQLDLITRR